MAEMSQEEMLAAQKAQCPFCKIVKGEIPSKKVYEDNIMLAILDINPANKGHVLVLPKEHYPILPLIPPPTFKHMFVTTKKLMGAMRKGLIVPKVTLFLANGGAAGQMSPHFLYHLIPREDHDGLDKLEMPKRETAQQELNATLGQNIQAIMRNHLARELQAGSPVAKLATKTNEPAQKTVVSPQTAPGIAMPDTTLQPSTTKEEAKQHLTMLLQQNPQLKQLIQQNPDVVAEYVKKSPELSVLFEGVDVHALSKKLNDVEGHQTTPMSETTKLDETDEAGTIEPEIEEIEEIELHNEPRPETKPAINTKLAQTPPAQGGAPIDDVPDAATMTDDELMNYLEQKPRLKELLINDLAALTELAKTNPRVNEFFKHTTPHALAERLLVIISKHDVKENEEKIRDVTEEEHDELEGADFLALSEYWRGKNEDLR